MENVGVARHSSRERVQTQRALEGSHQRRSKSVSSVIEDTIEVMDGPPAAPRTKRTVGIESSLRSKERGVATKIKAFTAKEGERATSTTANPTQSSYEKSNTTTNMQIKVLTDLVKTLVKAMEEQKETHANQLETLTKTFTQQIETLKAQVTAQVTEMTEKLETQLSDIQLPQSGTRSYADVARTPPSSMPSNLRTLNSISTTPSTKTDTLYCTIDISRVTEEERSKAQPGAVRKAIEEEIRTIEGQANWRCAAVIRDARNTERIRVACRDEAEFQQVKEAAQKTISGGARVLRDQLYPVKVDNANRTAILDQEGKVLPGAMEALGEENNVHIAKIGWLSKKDTGKAYGSMVVYVTKSSEATRLLQDQYFHVAGESAYTRTFEPQYGPPRCYKCQELGHKAYACTKPQVCAKCAQVGHHHNDCQAAIPKCTACGGPHESFSKNCNMIYPGQEVVLPTYITGGGPQESSSNCQVRQSRWND